MKKQEVLELLEEFPEEAVDTGELMYRLYVRTKLERAEEAVREGRVISHEEFVKQSQEWFR